MSDDPSVIQLVTEVLDSGRSPEEVCRTCPQQLDEVRRRVARCRMLVSRLDDLFSPADSGTDKDQNTAVPRLPDIPLYQVQAIIGEGGMGVVYSAQHLKLKRLVALKMLRSGAYASPAELGRFALEAQAIAGLRHPHIVEIYDLGEVEGRPYFTMEYLNGGSLAQKLDGAPLPPDQAARYLITMASAVCTAHQAGIVHRDLKPANVLFASDGRLKISDFGLALRTEVEDGLTLSGARIGTPSYMAPEQAAGHTLAIGPSADIYALGAILYEMLTGRPPFKGASAVDTERQVINDEPAAPRRLNTSVPRDLETICLKCLRKDPASRYKSAADLLADAERYSKGEPIHARPVGATERIFKWAHRRPAQTISIAASLILVIGLSGATLWYLSNRSARTRTVTADLGVVEELERQEKWADARTELQRAEFELGNHGPSELRHRIETDNHDLGLVAQLDSIRLQLARVAGNVSQTAIEDEFRPVFKDAGLDLFARDEDAAIAQIKNSPIRVAISDAMNDWVLANPDRNLTPWLLHVGFGSHEHQTRWEEQLRDVRVWQQKNVLLRIADTAPIEQESVSTLILVGGYLDVQGIPFLVKVQQKYPNDFWLNMTLGNAELRADNNEDAIRYLQTAVAIRPTAAVAEDNLAYALIKDGRGDEGLVHSQIALGLGFTSNLTYTNLSLMALKKGAEQVAAYRQQQGDMASKTGQTPKPSGLANLLAVGQMSDAMVHEYDLAFGSEAMTRLESRFQQWKLTLDANPPNYQSWSGYAELCLYLRHDDEYRRTRTRLLERFADATDPHTAERLGRACLLLPASDEETRKAVALIDRAVNANPSKVESWAPDLFQVAKALAEFRQGHLEGVRTIFSGSPYQVLKPMPQFIMAMTLQQQGNKDAARRLYESAVSSFDWNPNRATNSDAWMFQVIRREAEKMIELSSPPSTGPS